jgi:methionine-rich copper-binding protein CopC
MIHTLRTRQNLDHAPQLGTPSHHHPSSKIAGGYPLNARVWATGCALALLIGSWANPASAALRLTKSTPAIQSVVSESPSAITLWFDEFVRPDANLSSITLVDKAGATVVEARVPSTKATNEVSVAVPVVLPAGSYVVRWRIASDGELAQGQFGFQVLPPAGQ